MPFGYFELRFSNLLKFGVATAPNNLQHASKMSSKSTRFLAAVLAGTVSTQAATIINVDIQGGGSPRAKTGLAAYASDPAGAATVWNTTALSGSSLNDSTGAATSVGYTITSTNTTIGTWRQQNTGGGQDNLLYDYAFDNNANAASRNLTVTITGLDPTETHQLYVYGGIQFADNNDGTVDYTIGGNTQQIVWLGLDGGSSTTSYNLGENYTIFSGLSGSSITMTIAAPIGEPTITGFQIISVPEPGTSSLLLLLGGSCLLRRKRS